MVINVTKPEKAKTTQQMLSALEGDVPVVRKKISQDSVDQYMEAREEEDIQKQLDILFHILAGIDPEDS